MSLLNYKKNWFALQFKNWLWWTILKSFFYSGKMAAIAKFLFHGSHIIFVMAQEIFLYTLLVFGWVTTKNWNKLGTAYQCVPFIFPLSNARWSCFNVKTSLFQERGITRLRFEVFSLEKLWTFDWVLVPYSTLDRFKCGSKRGGGGIP